jgi:hypothetical protein
LICHFSHADYYAIAMPARRIAHTPPPRDVFAAITFFAADVAFVACRRRFSPIDFITFFVFFFIL